MKSERKYIMDETVFEATTFTNKIGQTLQPGDNVVVVTTGYGHSVSVYTGTYDGVYKRGTRIVGTRVSGIPAERTKTVYSADGDHEETKWEWDSARKTYKPIPTGRRYSFETVKYLRKSRLQRNRLFRIDTSLKEVTI